MEKKELLIIIPARINSKGIKFKNLLKINNIPLVINSLLFAKKIKINKIIFCSTDSQRIKKLVEREGIDVPTLRPKKISKDLSRDIDFVNHAINFFYKKKIIFQNCLILRPTSPYRKISSFKKAYNFFVKNPKADSLKAIYHSPKTPYKTWKYQKGFLKVVAKLNIKESFNAPRQILPKTYYQTGGIELIRINYKKKIKSISGKNILGYLVTKKESLDIDTINDLNN